MTTLRDWTAGEVEGSGNFDELMRTVKSHLVSEFSAGRITGTDYSTVYLNALQGALSASLQFTLQSPLTTQQELLLQEQVRNAQQDLVIKAAQIEQIEAQTTLLNSQNATELARELNVDSSTAINARQLQVLDGQISQLSAQTLLTNAQTVTQNNQGLLVTAQREQTEYQTENLLPQQLQRLLAETAVITQRRETENAQTSNIKIDGVTTVTGNIGRQNVLLENQAEGYLRTAEQNAAKIHADFFNIIQSTDGVTDYGLYGADGASVVETLDIMKQGIGISN